MVTSADMPEYKPTVMTDVILNIAIAKNKSEFRVQKIGFVCRARMSDERTARLRNQRHHKWKPCMPSAGQQRHAE